MPTQLKVIVEDGYVQNAPFTVNFAAPVIIQPGQKIALDKFIAVINGITTGFTLLPTKFVFYPSVNSPNLNSVDIEFEGGYYATASALLADLTTYFNNAISGYSPNFLPFYGLTKYYRDAGLKVVCTANNNSFELWYVTCPEETLVLADDNVTIDTDSYYSPDANGDFSMEQSDLGIFLGQGGGSIVEFQINVPTVAQGIAKQVSWGVGVTDDSEKFIGLGAEEDGILKLYNGEISTVVNVADFPYSPNAFVQLYQGNGKFILRSFLRDPTTKDETPIYNSDDVSSGALGTYDYTQQYHFEFYGTVGNIGGSGANVPGLHSSVTMTTDRPYGAIDNGFARTMAIDMTDASVLRAGLDIPAGVIYLTPGSSPYGLYTSSQPINMSIINSTFDIAMEILDLPLQTYQASSSGYPGQRNNVVAYFRPEPSNVGTSVYTYNSASYQWLDIDITYPVNLSSLSFRIYNPATGLDLNAQNLSFNLMINDTEY